MLCQICQSVLLRTTPELHDENPWTLSNRRHHESKQSLLAAVEQRCLVCWTFWYRASPEERSQWSSPSSCSLSDESDLTTVARWCGTRYDEDYYYPTHLIIESSDSTFPARSFNLTRLDTEHYPKGPISGGLRTGSNTNESVLGDQFAGSRELIQTWLRRCSSEHVHCRPDEGRQGWNPTRLLDISQISTGSINLVDTAYVSIALNYMTLSHRWGAAQPFKLSVESESELRRGLSLTKLPRTFQDAICVAHRLGVRYLWIDSLCVLQDEPDLTDWKHESALMHKVYGYSYCNLSATGVLNESEGLFPNADMEPAVTGSAELLVTDYEDIETTVSCAVVETDLWESNVEAMPLNKRGWVMQERLLAKRVLHFGHKQLFWECSETDACEIFPESLPSDTTSDHTRTLPQPIRLKALSMAVKLHVSETREIWMRIVEAYSSCQLTNPADKLFAIAGIASYMSNILGDNYVAGLWRSTLVFDLFWKVSDNQQARRQNKHGVPTWSWASIDGEVEYVCDQEARHITMRDVTPFDRTVDTTGLPKVEHILLECRISPFTVKRNNSALFEIGAVRVLNDREPGKNPNPCLEFTDLSISWDDVEYDVDADEGRGLLYCITGSKGIIEGLRCLLLVRCEDEATGTFSRVGLARMKPVIDGVHYEYKPLIDGYHYETIHNPKARSLPCVTYDERSRRHTIRLI